MKETIFRFRGIIATMAILLLVGLPGWAANKKTTVEQVTTVVTVDEDVDYVVTSATPFADGGVVNLTNTEHAVLILENVKPSAALRLLGAHVQVNGAKAVNNSTCQVKLYNLGCIILPYSKSLKPLTVYSEQNFEGESCNDFGLENSNGYMNTLTEKKLNNRIRSFKLKRGYMVTFANRGSGRGYSRCFIAADQDLEMATLPGVLDKSISSYRVFKWYDAGKKQLANDLTSATLSALNVQSSYTWSQGHDMAPDFECVPNHIYEDYPSSAAIGQATWSPHSKNNNEPRNSSDDHPQDLKTILDNWENMMRTGMRLCSPASWDGSDYWNATGFLAEFLDSIDARGWRCDIIDLHCYWAEGNFGNISNWVNKYKRPVWISEWCWGASWNKNGAFADGVTEAQVRDALQRICTNLNNWNYVERYYYWNSERDPSRLYKNGSLTPAGKYYAAMNSGLGYNGKYDFAPKVPKMYDPSNFSVDYDKNTHTATLTWHEPNGELNVSMNVQRRENGNSTWEDLGEVALKEVAADYSFADTDSKSGYQYRVVVVDANNKERATKAVTAASSDLEAGDAIDVNGVTKYLGGNVFLNGNFDMGAFGWTNGKGGSLEQPYFQVVPVGGNDGGPYLQAYGGGSTDSESAIKTAFKIKPNATYYYSGAACNSPVLSQLVLSADGAASGTSVATLLTQMDNWTTLFTLFETKEYEYAIVSFRTLAAKAKFDQLLLCQLFDTEAEAIADGIEKAREKASLFEAYNQLYPELTADLKQQMADAGADRASLAAMQQAIARAIAAYHTKAPLDELLKRAAKLAEWNLAGTDRLRAAIVEASIAKTAIQVTEDYEALKAAIEEYIPLVATTGNVKSPKFAATTGWTTKCGTYTGGDQRQNTVDGVTFWNAWWSGISASEGAAKTMAIKQNVAKLGHGLYALECKASTEHYCLSDQHGYITSGDVTENTPKLTADYFDLPTVSKADRWQKLLSDPVYVDEGGSVTIGFIGSKDGAVDNAWHKVGDTKSTGDKREGWWGATDFVLMFHPLYRIATVPGQFEVTCLPYAVKASAGVKLYQIAGITADFTKLCLEEIQEQAAGVPFIYLPETSLTSICEYGDKSNRNGEGPGGLRGFLSSSAREPLDYYALHDGQWVKVTEENRGTLSSFTAVLRPLDDEKSNLPRLKDWEGVTMPIVGVTEAEKTAGIGTLVYQSSDRQDGIYTIDGRRVITSQPLRGIYIVVENGQPRKAVVK